MEKIWVGKKHVHTCSTNSTFDNFIFAVLRVQSIASGEREEYIFPNMKDIAGIALPNGSIVNISIPMLQPYTSGELIRRKIKKNY